MKWPATEMYFCPESFLLVCFHSISNYCIITLKNIALGKFVILLNKQDENKDKNEEIQKVIFKEDPKTVFVSFSQHLSDIGN